MIRHQLGPIRPAQKPAPFAVTLNGGATFVCTVASYPIAPAGEQRRRMGTDGNDQRHQNNANRSEYALSISANSDGRARH